MEQDAQPQDKLSQRIEFEQIPRHWGGDDKGDPRRGVRLKVGSGTIGRGNQRRSGKAIRGGLKVKLPQFLDLDSPYLFQCEQGADTSRCDGKKRVGSNLDEWRGLEAQAIKLRVVAAEDEPLGVQGISGGIGRVALLSHSFDKGTQAILTGPPPRGGDLADSGGTGYTPENPPAPGEADQGLEAPSYLDARLWVTTDYTSQRTSDSTVVTYAQVDTRSTGPLEAAVRLNGPTALEDMDGRTATDLENRPLSSGTNRAGERVAQLQFNVRDIPGLPEGGTKEQLLAKPTFRTRAELRGAGPRPGPGVKGIITCDNYNTAVFRVIHACLDISTGATKWVNVNLSATPPDAGDEGPARTIEAVIDTSRVKGAEAEVRGYKQVFDLPDQSRGDADHARFTAEAGLRLAPFQAFANLGGGVTHLIVPGLSGFSIRFGLNGDLAVNGGAGNSRRLLLTSDIGKVNVGVSGGRARVEGDLVGRSQFKLTWLPLFGLISLPVFTDNTPDHDEPPARAKLLFDTCDGDHDLGENVFFLDGESNPFDDPARTEAGLEVDAQSGHELGFLVPAAADVVDEITCKVGADGTRALIDDHHPAPRTTVGPKVDGTPSTPTTPTIPAPDRPDEPVADLVVPERQSIDLCGVHEFRNVVLERHAKIEVSGEGCDGRLLLRAHDVHIKQSARIMANGRIHQAHDGTPQAGLGGGAGHHDRGGKSGISETRGGKYGPSPDFRDADIGSPGATGRKNGEEVPAGAGGGVIQIFAKETIRIENTDDSHPETDPEARLDASGAGGGHATGGDCSSVGGGGGSGGTIELVANKVVVPGPAVGNSAHLMVQGGPGGDGSNGGGGGSGGRVRIRAISEDADDDDFHAEGGDEGEAKDSRACDDGDDGDGGEKGEGDRFDMLESAANVRRTDGTDETQFVRGKLDLRLRVISNWSATSALFSTRGAVCYRYGGTAGGLGNPELNPPQDVPPGDLITDQCAKHDFGRSLSDIDEEVTVDFHRQTDDGIERPLPDGYYGFYGLGYRTFLTGNVDDMQDKAPEASPVRLAVDNTRPGIADGQIRDTTEGCPDGSRCAKGSHVRLDVPVTDNFSGIAEVVCTVRNAEGENVSTDEPCDPQGREPLDLGDGSGLHTVHMKATDVAGNETRRRIGKVWIDRTAPAKPAFTQPQGDANNGTFRGVPSFTVASSDPVDDTSGFADHDAIELVIDGATRSCGVPGGEAAAGPGEDPGEGPGEDPGEEPGVEPVVSCSADVLRAILEPFGDGRHEITAKARDRAGHESAVSETLVIVIDTKAPRTQLLLSPRDVDGGEGWRRTQPLLLFAVRDGAQGSGVAIDPREGDDLPADGKSGIYLRLGDSGPFERYDPGKPRRLPDGVHQVCWFAIDLAGHKEPENCPARAKDIKVDTTPPAPELQVSPSAPDGGGGWYRTRPELSFEGGDDAGSGVAASGIQYAIDEDGRGESWRRYDAAAKPALSDGKHEVCWYAEDRAGNRGARGVAGATACRPGLRVDTTAPPAAELHLDVPRPDGRDGWYRTAPRLLFAGADTPGGSGLAGVRYAVDGGAEQDYDVAAPPQLADGEHEVCWTTADVAGNRSAPACRVVKVDTTAPAATAPVTPAAPDGDGGFHRTQPVLAPAGSDAGSGVQRVELQLGDAPWEAAQGGAALPEGSHDVRVRAVDAAGNVSPVGEQVVRYDGVDPQVRVGTTPGAPNVRGWFRRSPLLAAQASDTATGSGVPVLRVALDGATNTYQGPIRIGEGDRSAQAMAADRSGREAAPQAPPLRVDLTPPVPRPGTVPILTPPGGVAQLPFTVTDAPGMVKVRVHVFDALGNHVRTLNAPGTRADGFRPAGSGHVVWDGKTSQGGLVNAGLYHFRVQAIDSAGNAAGSTESPSFLLIRIGSILRVSIHLL